VVPLDIHIMNVFDQLWPGTAVRRRFGRYRNVERRFFRVPLKDQDLHLVSACWSGGSRLPPEVAGIVGHPNIPSLIGRTTRLGRRWKP